MLYKQTAQGVNITDYPIYSKYALALLLWADLDGDGKPHELISGKRVDAHEIEPGATDGSLIAWYHFDPQAKNWVKHVIFQGQPAKDAPQKVEQHLALKDFPPGTAGTGLQLTAIDIDGDLDLVCPARAGCICSKTWAMRRESLAQECGSTPRDRS